MMRTEAGHAGRDLALNRAMYVVKVYCGSEAPSIAPPFSDIVQALRWIAAKAWTEFDGDAEHAEIFEFDATDRRLALREVRAGNGRLIKMVRRPPTPEQQRRAAAGRGEN
jgi:hypothetical protein